MAATQIEIAKEVVDSRARMSEAVDFANKTRNGIQVMNDGIRLMIEAVEKKHKEIDERIELGEQESSTAVENLNKARAKLINELQKKFATTDQETETKFEVLRQNLLAWSVSFRQQLQDKCALCRGAHPEARGSGGRADGSTPKHGKKDLAVWKLADQVSKLDFRH